MAKPWIHACSSARRYGGKPEDYLPIHDFLDSSKGTVADSRHRALTHTTWFLSTVLERVFGTYITNEAGKKVQVRDIGEQHVLEDFGGRFIPTPQDYLQHTDFREWMLAGKGDPPESFSRLSPKARRNMSAAANYQEAKARLERARQEMANTAKAAFAEASKELFDAHPTISSFGWKQYTPYFNDGDTCEFSAGTDYPFIRFRDDPATIKDEDDEGDEDDDDDDEEWSSWDVEKKVKANIELTPNEKAGLATVEFLGSFDDDTYLELFGDHVKVTVSRDSVEVDEYDHE